MHALVVSATALLVERGPAAVSVRDIAEAAGVNHALIFRHFGSKEGLLRAVVARQLEGLLADSPEVGEVPAGLAWISRGRTYAVLVARFAFDGLEEQTMPSEFAVLRGWIALLEERRREADGLVPPSPTCEPRAVVAAASSLVLGYLVYEPFLRATLMLDGADLDPVVALMAQSLLERVTDPRPAVSAPRRRARRDPVPNGRDRGTRPYGRDEVMAAVLDAATDLFGRQGPVATSVRDLAKAAGVNHALIFRHFGSKEGLLRSVMDRQVQIVVPRAREITSTRDDLYHLARACRTESRYAWLIGRAVLDGYDPGSFRSSFPVVGHLRQVLRREVAEGGASSSRVLDPDHALAGVLALALGSVIFERYLRAATGLDDSVDFDAVVADCGQALFDLAR